MKNFQATDYKLVSLGTGKECSDDGFVLDFSENPTPSLIRTQYASRQLRDRVELEGLYRFADWLPLRRLLDGATAPITYKSESLARELGLRELWITFSGWWPERGALMRSGTFKECEAYSVGARLPHNTEGVLVVASAGNTARAFAQVCSDNKLPLLLCVPENGLRNLWFEAPLNSCVKLVVPGLDSDYFDAIELSQTLAALEGFFPEGGAKNVARRDGMATTVYSAVSSIGRIPDVYFQAVGSGTGAIAAWEASLRFLEDGRFGQSKMRLMVSQNEPFTPMKTTWEAGSREFLIPEEAEARRQIKEINASVLSNRFPPWGIVGGLFDALTDSGGDVITVNNEEADQAAQNFLALEGIDVSPAAAVGTASLYKAVKMGLVDAGETIMLNVTGGGWERFKKDKTLFFLQPDIVFSQETPSEKKGELILSLLTGKRNKIK